MLLAVVPSAPPQNISGKSLNSTAIEVSWTPPPVDKLNGKIVGYRVAYGVATNNMDVKNATTVTINEATTIRFIVGSLEMFTPYKFWVSAHTRIGEGPHSDVIVVKTDEDGMFWGLLPLTTEIRK